MSPRLTPQQLAQARKRAEADRQQQLEAREALKRQEAEQATTYEVLRTVQDALYAEIDKLNKKASKENCSEYTLRKVNEHIATARQFLAVDAYVNGLTEFVAAGDNPEYRDIALVLAEVDAALKRFRAGKERSWSKF